jgi:hypothetical protein
MAAGKQGLPYQFIINVGFSELIQQINDGRDFQEYVLAFGSKVPADTRYSGPPADGNVVAGPQAAPANLDRYSVS